MNGGVHTARKQIRSNLQVRRVPHPVWIGPEVNSFCPRKTNAQRKQGRGLDADKSPCYFCVAGLQYMGGGVLEASGSIDQEARQFLGKAAEHIVSCCGLPQNELQILAVFRSNHHCNYGRIPPPTPSPPPRTKQDPIT